MEWLGRWIEINGLKRITLFAQDWGSLLSLRLVGERPELFARIVISNGALPLADRPVNFAFKLWKSFAKYSPIMPIGQIVRLGTGRKLSAQEIAAYNAPFPSEKYKMGAKAFPLLVPTDANDVAVPANRKAWQALCQSNIPLLTAFGENDPFLGKMDLILQKHVKGAQGRHHTRLNGGHFIQEDCGPELVGIIDEFIRQT